jgi:hypothetical protein
MWEDRFGKRFCPVLGCRKESKELAANHNGQLPMPIEGYFRQNVMGLCGAGVNAF